MPVLLNVPFFSQEGAGANKAWADCVIACVRMGMHYVLGWSLPVDTLIRRTILRTNPNQGVSFESAVGVFGIYGVNANVFRYRDLDVLKVNLVAGLPMIVEFPAFQNMTHACVVCGYNEQIDRWTVHNPAYKTKILNSADMAKLFSFRGGLAYGVKINGRYDHISQLTAYPQNQFANIRNKPSLKSDVVGQIKSKEVIRFSVSSVVFADRYHWVTLQDGRGWVALEVV